MDHSDLNAALSMIHLRSSPPPPQMQPQYAVPFFAMQPQFTPQPLYSLRSPFAPQPRVIMQPPYAQLSPFAPKQEQPQFAPRPLYSTYPLYQQPPRASQSLFNLPPQQQPVADFQHPFVLKSELHSPSQPQLNLEEHSLFTSQPKSESQTPLNLKLKMEKQPSFTPQPKLESKDMFELHQKWDAQPSLSPQPKSESDDMCVLQLKPDPQPSSTPLPELEPQLESPPAVTQHLDPEIPPTSASQPSEPRGRNTDPSPDLIYISVQVKTHLLSLAVEHEAWRQVHGEHHSRVTELAVEIRRLKQILIDTNILSSEFTENQRMIMLEEANNRAAWLRCASSTRTI